MENENSENKIPLEQEKLEEAAENLKNIQFSGDNYKELLEIITAFPLSQDAKSTKRKSNEVKYLNLLKQKKFLRIIRFLKPMKWQKKLPLPHQRIL